MCKATGLVNVANGQLIVLAEENRYFTLAVQERLRQVVVVVQDIRLHMHVVQVVVAERGQEHLHLSGLAERVAGLH